VVELEESRIDFKPIRDRRPHMPEPPPVRLVAVADVHVPAAAGLEVQLDDFYVKLLRFDREGADLGQVTYKSENFRLCFDVLEPPIPRDDFRPIMIDVPSLSLVEEGIIQREIEYEKHKGLAPGHRTLLLQDPTGNWVQLGEMKRVG
jgi:hypothetical protein